MEDNFWYGEKLKKELQETIDNFFKTQHQLTIMPFCIIQYKNVPVEFTMVNTSGDKATQWAVVNNGFQVMQKDINDPAKAREILETLPEKQDCIIIEHF